jgi:hypothetical protein
LREGVFQVNDVRCLGVAFGDQQGAIGKMPTNRMTDTDRGFRFRSGRKIEKNAATSYPARKTGFE